MQLPGLSAPALPLDAPAAERLRSDLRSRLERGAGLVIVTHQLGEVWDLTSRVAVLIEGRWAVDEPRSGELNAFVSRYGMLTGA